MLKWGSISGALFWIHFFCENLVKNGPKRGGGLTFTIADAWLYGLRCWLNDLIDHWLAGLSGWLADAVYNSGPHGDGGP